MVLKKTASLIGLIGLSTISFSGFILAWEGEPGACSLKVSYSVSLKDNSNHICAVEVLVQGIEHPYLDLSLSAWNNLYQLRDFVKNLRDLTAWTDTGGRLEVRRISSHTWRVLTSGSRSLKVAYEVFANHPGDYYSQIDQEHAFLNGANIFIYISGHLQVPATVEFRDLPRDWKIATALSPGQGVGQFQADDYYQLIDCPIEMSAFGEFRFRLHDVSFRVVFHGQQGMAERGKMESTIKTIVTAAFDLMHDVPLESYVFIYHFTGLDRGGGMEHRNSTAINVPPADSAEEDSPYFLRIALVTAHEFFHLWNVKRIRPENSIHPDLTKPFATPTLWFSEGFTSY